MARTACLVCYISTLNGHCNKKRKEKKRKEKKRKEKKRKEKKRKEKKRKEKKRKEKKRKEEAYPWKAGDSSGHTTNLTQSI